MWSFCEDCIESTGCALVHGSAVNLALAVYPEARVDADKQRLILHPSRPAVPKAGAKRLGIT
jgi:hypothetical protein